MALATDSTLINPPSAGLSGDIADISRKRIHFSRTAVEHLSVYIADGVQDDVRMVMRTAAVFPMKTPQQLVIRCKIRYNRIADIRRGKRILGDTVIRIQDSIHCLCGRPC